MIVSRVQYGGKEVKQKCSERPTKSSIERQECEVREYMCVATAKCKCMASLVKCNNDTWGLASDEVGKTGKKWDE